MEKNNKSEDKNKLKIIVASLLALGIFVTVFVSFMNNKNVIAEGQNTDNVAISEDSSEEVTVSENSVVAEEVTKLEYINSEKEEIITEEVTESTTIQVIETVTEATTQATTIAPTTQNATEKVTQSTTKKQTTTKAKSSNKTPQMGDKDGNGNIYVDGFGWVKDEGGGTNIKEANFELTGNKVGY